MAKRTKSKTRKAAAAPRPARKTADESFLAFAGANPKTMENLMNQSRSQMDKMTGEASNIAREGFDAFSKSLKIFSKGCEEIMKTSIAMSQEALERQSQLYKDSMSVKSLNEWAEVQNKIAQSNFDEMMTSATKISEMSVKMLSESAEPLNSQLTKSIRKASEAMAA
ncbi:MAG: phasin family protein [Alphaproteobacteria bacterium]|nr:phasin family protein [Alphaproteobacteria bacterium]